MRGCTATTCHSTGNPPVTEQSADHRGEVRVVDGGRWGHPWAQGPYQGLSCSTSSPGGQLPFTCRAPTVCVASGARSTSRDRTGNSCSLRTPMSPSSLPTPDCGEGSRLPRTGRIGFSPPLWGRFNLLGDIQCPSWGGVTWLTVPNSNETFHASMPDLRAGGIQSGGPPVKGEGAEQGK